MSTSLKSIVRKMRVHIRQEEIELEIDEELQYHIDMREQDNLSKGMAPEEARANALTRFGDYEMVKRECYTAGREAEIRRIDLRAAAPLAIMALGMLFMVWTFGRAENNIELLFSTFFTVIILLISLISIPNSFKTSKNEQKLIALGLNDDDNPSANIHQDDGKSPLERALEDR